MSTFDFEEYRLPWETGPHWELKKEFMEKYKDNFPKDRLLCLAQAYSNMELLDCTYPDPVMIEVHELAKSLHVCKRLREASQKKEMENSSKKKRGKRKLSSENLDNKYFIKFCSATPDKKLATMPDLNVTSSIASDSSNATHKQENTDFVKPNIVISGAIDAYDKDSSGRDDYFILNITRSPDFFDIKTLAHDIKASSGNPLGRLENAVSKFGLDKVKFEFNSLSKTPGCLCHFYIRNTLICIGKESNEKCARIKAAEYAIEILSNLENLPCKTLNDLKSFWVKQDDTFLSLHKDCCNKGSDLVSDSRARDIKFWLNFAQKAKEKIGKSQTNFILDNAAKELQTSIFTFAFTEDLNSPMNNRLFSCYLVLEKTIIYQAVENSKKKAKTKALASGLTCILDLIKWYEESIHKSNRNYIPDFPITKDSDTALIVMEEIKDSTSKQDLSLNQKPDISGTQMSNENSVNVLSSRTEEKRKADPGPFRLNRWLLQNSMQRQLVICDTSEIFPYQSVHPASVLQYSAALCQKTMTYEVEEVPLPSNERLFRCKVLFGKEVMGCGESSTKIEAKANAAANTMASLKQCVYTVKVKNELSDGFVINRSQVTDMEFSSNSIPENNVGCKLLKMMGWSGGAIGNKGGLTEPITASDHHFHQGLGFSKKSESEEKYFKQKINALLKDFSQSSAIGDLIFSTDFSKEERQSIHQIALRYNLHSTSRGKDKDRQLFIKRKKSIQELLSLIVQAGGSTSKYELLDCSM